MIACKRTACARLMTTAGRVVVECRGGVSRSWDLSRAATDEMHAALSTGLFKCHFSRMDWLLRASHSISAVWETAGPINIIASWIGWVGRRRSPVSGPREPSDGVFCLRDVDVTSFFHRPPARCKINTPRTGRPDGTASPETWRHGSDVDHVTRATRKRNVATENDDSRTRRRRRHVTSRWSTSGCWARAGDGRSSHWSPVVASAPHPVYVSTCSFVSLCS